MTAVPRLSWAEAKRNGDFIQVETYSGYGITTSDPLGKQHLLAAGASDDDIGTAVLDCLEHSRFIPPDESPDEDLALFDPEAIQARYSKWVASLMSAFGYKSRTMLFKGMSSCCIECCDGVITIAPTHHEKLEAWSGDGIDVSDSVLVAASGGAVLRLASP